MKRLYYSLGTGNWFRIWLVDMAGLQTHIFLQRQTFISMLCFITVYVSKVDYLGLNYNFFFLLSAALHVTAQESKGFRQGCQVYVTKPVQLLLTNSPITAQTPITFRLSKLLQCGSKPPSEGFYLGWNPVLGTRCFTSTCRLKTMCGSSIKQYKIMELATVSLGCVYYWRAINQHCHDLRVITWHLWFRWLIKNVTKISVPMRKYVYILHIIMFSTIFIYFNQIDNYTWPTLLRW